MSEQFKGENRGKDENLIQKETQLYAEAIDAIDEETRIMAEIDKVFKTTKDRSEAEKI